MAGIGVRQHAVGYFKHTRYPNCAILRIYFIVRLFTRDEKNFSQNDRSRSACDPQKSVVHERGLAGFIGVDPRTRGFRNYVNGE